MTITRNAVFARTLRSILVVLLLASSGAALAGDTKDFDQATFTALRSSGKPILVDVYADWCPTCKAQAPILSELLARPEFKDYTVLRVNFDTQKDVRRTLHVPQQSTLIVYRGGREVARTTGDTDKASIEATLRKGSAKG